MSASALPPPVVCSSLGLGRIRPTPRTRVRSYNRAMEPASLHAFMALGTALGLGLLVGLQRERGYARLAGIRTFPLITLLGTLSGLTVPAIGPWVVVAAALGVAASILVGAIERTKSRADEPEREVSVTTEFAIVLMFVVGVYLALGPASIAVVTAGLVAVLLHLKEALHTFARRVGEKDARAIAQFTLISLVILPVLPNETYGPYDVLNPRNIWLMVVLVVSISLAAYIARRLVGARAGVVLGGLLGGAISSTATTASYARQTGGRLISPAAACLAVLLASAVAYVRVIIELGVVAPDHLRTMAPPFAMMLGVLAIFSLLAVLTTGRETPAELEHRNPTELKAALIFGGLYALVILAVAAADDLLGDRGLYAVAVVSGLTDMDAVTLSTGRLVQGETLGVAQGWRVILLASMSNLLFKLAIAWGLGGRRVAWRLAIAYAFALAAGAALLVWW
jgi:uncharacterized membrane protein (DUF4010 family)